MRETGVVRFQTSGNKAVVETYIGEARKQLGILKDRMAAFGMQDLAHQRTYADGTIVTVRSCYGQDTIQIDAPVRVERAEPAPVPLVELEGESNPPNVYSIVVGVDENVVLDMEGAYAGGNGKYYADRNTLDNPAAYSSGSRRIGARGGQYAVLTAISFVPDSFPEHAVDSVADTALYNSCNATIRVTTEPPLGLLGPDLSVYYKRLFDDAHWPLLHKQFMNFMGLVKMPDDVRWQLNQYIPVRLYPIHYYLDTDEDVVVVFGMQQVVGNPTPVVSGIYSADYSNAYDTTEIYNNQSNTWTVALHRVLFSLLARCKAKNLPLAMRAPAADYPAALLPTSIGKDVNLVAHALGDSVPIVVFGVTLRLPVPASLELVNEFASITDTIDDHLVTYDFLGGLDEAGETFTGILRPRAVVPPGQIYSGSPVAPVALTAIADQVASSSAEYPATQALYTTTPVKLPLDFLTIVDTRHLIRGDKWFTPAVSLPAYYPNLHLESQVQIGLAGEFIYNDYNDNSQTGKRYVVDGRGHPLAPFNMVFAVEEFLGANYPLPPNNYSARWIPAFTQVMFRFAASGALEVAETSGGAVLASYSTSYNIAVTLTGPLTLYGHHKGTTYAVATFTTTHVTNASALLYSVTYESTVASITGVTSFEYGRAVEGSPVVYPDANFGVVFPPGFSSANLTNYAFYYKGVRIAGPAVPASAPLPTAPSYDVQVVLYNDEAIGSDGVGTISAGGTHNIPTPQPGYPRFYNPTAVGSSFVPIFLPEYPMAGAGVRDSGLVVTMYLRNAKGTDAGVCIIQRSFAADIFATMYLCNPFTQLQYIHNVIVWFLDIATQPGAPEAEEDPAARASFPAMIASAEAARAMYITWYDSGASEELFDKEAYRLLIRDIARNGRRVLVNNFANIELIDFLTSHSQTLVILPYTSELLAAA